MSQRRAALVTAALALVFGGAGCATNNVEPPMCHTDTALAARILVSQSVPSAAIVPCIDVIPAGWSYGGMTVAGGSTVFTMDNDRGGIDALRTTFASSCDIGDARPQRPQGDEVGTQKFVRPVGAGGQVLPGTTHYRFEGGCITVEYALTPGAPSTLFAEGSALVSFLPRSEVVGEVDSLVGQTLCGAEAPPCP